MIELLFGVLVGASIAQESNKETLPVVGYSLDISVEEEKWGPDLYLGRVQYIFKTKNECRYSYFNKVYPKLSKYYKLEDKEYWLDSVGCQPFMATDGPPLSDPKAMEILTQLDRRI